MSSMSWPLFTVVFILTWNRRAGAGVGAIPSPWAAMRRKLVFWKTLVFRPFWRLGLCYREGSGVFHVMSALHWLPQRLGPSSDLHREDPVRFLEEKPTKVLGTPETAGPEGFLTVMSPTLGL